MVLKMCVSTRERKSFECRILQRTFTYIYVDFLLSVAAWTRIADDGVNTKETRQLTQRRWYMHSSWTTNPLNVKEITLNRDTKLPGHTLEN